MKKYKNKKGFTLIELIVVIAVLGILVLLAAPRFLGYTDKAKVTELTNNNKIIETASQMYHMDNDDWPRLTDDPYTADEVDAFAEKIYHLTGEEVELDPDGNYYDIDFDKLSEHVKVPGDPANYILQNPVGKVYALYKPTETAKDRLPSSPVSGGEESNGIYTEEEIEALVAKGYTRVSTAEELDEVRNNLSGKYIQTKDIDLSGYSATDGNGWEPIGTQSTSFLGTYDGGGLKVAGLTIDRPGETNIGLFGYSIGATIENVRLENVSVKGKVNVGALIGLSHSKSKVLNSHSSGEVTGEHYIGGLVGVNQTNSLVSDSNSTGMITGSVNYVGGLVGKNYYSTVLNSYSKGTVNGVHHVAGLVAYNYESTISNSYSTGTVTGSGSNVGGLVGRNFVNSTISKSYSTSLTTSTGPSVGGLVGANIESKVEKSYFDKEVHGSSISSGGEAKSTAEMKSKSTYSGWDFDTIWQIEPDQYPTLRQSK